MDIHVCLSVCLLVCLSVCLLVSVSLRMCARVYSVAAVDSSSSSFTIRHYNGKVPCLRCCFARQLPVSLMIPSMAVRTKELQNGSNLEGPNQGPNS